MTTPKKLIQTATVKPLYDAMVMMAEQDGVNRSELLRRLITNEAQKRGLWPPRKEVQNGKL